jgi:hypothetical protein
MGRGVFNRLIAESDKVFGSDSKSAIGAVSNLGMVYEQLGKYKEAEASLRRSMIWAVKSLGQEGLQYLGVVRGLIDILEKQGKFVEVDEMLIVGFVIMERMSRPFNEEETKEMQTIEQNFNDSKKRGEAFLRRQRDHIRLVIKVQLHM